MASYSNGSSLITVIVFILVLFIFVFPNLCSFFPFNRIDFAILANDVVAVATCYAFFLPLNIISVSSKLPISSCHEPFYGLQVGKYTHKMIICEWMERTRKSKKAYPIIQQSNAWRKTFFFVVFNCGMWIFPFKYSTVAQNSNIFDCTFHFFFVCENVIILRAHFIAHFVRWQKKARDTKSLSCVSSALFSVFPSHSLSLFFRMERFCFFLSLCIEWIAFRWAIGSVGYWAICISLCGHFDCVFVCACACWENWIGFSSEK